MMTRSIRLSSNRSWSRRRRSQKSRYCIIVNRYQVAASNAIRPSFSQKTMLIPRFEEITNTSLFLLKQLDYLLSISLERTITSYNTTIVKLAFSQSKLTFFKMLFFKKKQKTFSVFQYSYRKTNESLGERKIEVGTRAHRTSSSKLARVFL